MKMVDDHWSFKKKMNKNETDNLTIESGFCLFDEIR